VESASNVEVSESSNQYEYSFLDYRVSVFCPSSGTLKEQNVSETGAVCILRKKGGETLSWVL
jgi:hypothetical protein